MPLPQECRYLNQFQRRRGGKPFPYKWRFLNQVMEVKGEGLLILVLRANSTLDQAAADLDNYGRKVDREFRNHSEWASRI